MVAAYARAGKRAQVWLCGLGLNEAGWLDIDCALDDGRDRRSNLPSVVPGAFCIERKVMAIDSTRQPGWLVDCLDSAARRLDEETNAIRIDSDVVGVEYLQGESGGVADDPVVIEHG